jgi:hypothetical protein
MSVSLRKLPVLVAGIAYAADGLWQLRHHQPDHHWTTTDRWIEVLFAVALLASIAALPAIRELATAGRAGAVGTRIAQLGFAVLSIASTASLVHGGNVLGFAFGLGLLAALIGLGMLTVAGFRDGQMQWAAPILLAGFVVGMVLGDHGGTVLIGAAWLAVGWLIDNDSQPASAGLATAT